MKKIAFLIYFSFVFSLTSFAQKTKITTLYDGVIIRENDEKKGGITVNKNNYNKEEYLMSVKPGYVTKLFKLDTIMSANLPEYQIKLTQLFPLDYNKVKNKIVFSGFIDKQNKIKLIDYVNSYGNSYTYNLVNLSSEEFKASISSMLVENKFKVYEENEVFKSKKNIADYALAGEILDYQKNTKGPGFVTSVVVKWSIYDIQKEETILKITSGGYSNTQTKLRERDVVKLALQDALGSIIIDSDVIKLMYGNEDSESSSKLQIEIPKISAVNSENNNYIEKAIQSSVTIKSNGGHGSGFLISADGYILTNFHVIEDSSNLQAIFQSGLTLPLQIISFNKKRDVALCKIPGKGYSPLPIDSNSVKNKIGSDVVAIGTPEDIKLGQTVTKGIISGLREVKDNIYIQTDVSINSGNSGGMLVDKNGNVIGIISAKMKGEGIEGLGFAIPINEALNRLKIKITEK